MPTALRRRGMRAISTGSTIGWGIGRGDRFIRDRRSRFVPGPLCHRVNLECLRRFGGGACGRYRLAPRSAGVLDVAIDSSEIGALGSSLVRYVPASTLNAYGASAAGHAGDIDWLHDRLAYWTWRSMHPRSELSVRPWSAMSPRQP